MSRIEWCDVTWNPTRGCSRVSEGCRNCFAMGQAHRFSGAGKPYDGLTTIRRGKVDWTGLARLHPEMLAQPLKWKKPRRVFVNSMSDLFHESLSNEDIAAVFGVMAAAPWQTFQVLTKRAKRMREWFVWAAGKFTDQQRVIAAAPNTCRAMLDAAFEFGIPKYSLQAAWDSLGEADPWPLPNVWLGVSVENQDAADKRIPELLATPAAVRFISAEPLLGRVDLRLVPYRGGIDLNWVIVGGESGRGARPFDVEWARTLVDQCRGAGVACFVKQLGANIRDRNDAGFDGDPDDAWNEGVAIEYDPDGTNDHRQGALVRVRLADKKGGDPSEWPESLRVRQFPTPRTGQSGRKGAE